MVGMAGHSGMVHLGHLRVLLQEVDHLQCVLYVALHTQAERLQTLQQDEGIERRDGCTGVTQYDGTDAGDEGCSTSHVGKHSTVV